MRNDVAGRHRRGMTTHADPTTKPSISTVETSRSPRHVIEELYAAFGRGDMAGLLALIDPDVDWSLQVDALGAELVPMLRNGIGHEAVKRYFSGVADMEFHVFAPQAFHVAGDVVLVELVLDFSHRKTGKRARLEEIHRFVVRDGRIVHYRPFVDTATLIDTFRP